MGLLDRHTHQEGAHVPAADPAVYQAPLGVRFVGAGLDRATVYVADHPTADIPLAALCDYGSFLALSALQRGQFTVGAVAVICHEANRILCAVFGDKSQKPWVLAEEWQRQSAVDGVQYALDNPDADPAAQHAKWMADKLAAGWVLGEVKDAEAVPPTHPDLVPYDELPEFAKAKDHLFKGIVNALAGFVGVGVVETNNVEVVGRPPEVEEFDAHLVTDEEAKALREPAGDEAEQVQKEAPDAVEDLSHLTPAEGEGGPSGQAGQTTATTPENAVASPPETDPNAVLDSTLTDPAPAEPEPPTEEEAAEAPADVQHSSSAPPRLKQGSLPEDFPARGVLAENGISTWAQLRKVEVSRLTDLPGIGDATVKKIEDYMVSAGG
jgi:hypothetical protein